MAKWFAMSGVRAARRHLAQVGGELWAMAREGSKCVAFESNVRLQFEPTGSSLLDSGVSAVVPSFRLIRKGTPYVNPTLVVEGAVRH